VHAVSGRSIFSHQASLTGFIASSILLVAAIIALLLYFGVHDQVLHLLSWVEAQGAWAALLFILLMALVVVLLLPGVLFTTGAGFVFGVLQGTLYVVLGTTLGAVMAFLIARYLFGERATLYVRTHARIQLVSDELTPHGWKIVLLSRLVPFFPSKLANYFFGLTRFSLGGYTVASLIGFIPFSVHNVYLGSIAADLATLGAQHAERTPLQWALYASGFAITVVAVIWISRLAQRALARYQGPAGDEQ
jgi:uncharacterized membrane protein YdjX (TVP38/TMEM64 family)